MPELLQAALATAGLGWLLLIAWIAGLVYGFAGFGAALIYMPSAVIFLPPAEAIAAFSVSALSSFVTVVPKALPLVDRKAVTVLIVSAALSASLGIWVLSITDVTIIRWGVVAICTTTLIALIGGWRYSVTPGTRTRVGIGVAAGFVGGVSGLTGPILVLFQLAGRDTAATNRATTIVFLSIVSLMMLPLLYLQGMLAGATLMLGLLLLAPYGLGAALGQALFTPGRERFYRTVAYVIIGAATVAGVPMWDQM